MLGAVLQQQIDQLSVVVLDNLELVEGERICAMRLPGRLKLAVHIRAGAQLEPNAILLRVEIARRADPILARRSATHREDARARLLFLVFADEVLPAYGFFHLRTYPCDLRRYVP